MNGKNQILYSMEKAHQLQLGSRNYVKTTHYVTEVRAQVLTTNTRGKEGRSWYYSQRPQG